MKLQFVYKTDRKILVFDTLEQIKSKVEDADVGFYHYIRALELNAIFQSIIEWYRQKYNIPLEGYDYSDNENIILPKHDDGYEWIGIEFNMFNLDIENSLQKYNLLPTILKVIPYISFFNRVPVIRNTHLYWAPNINVFDEDQYEAQKHLLKKEHQYNLPKDFFDNSGNCLQQYERDLLNTPYSDIYTSVEIKISSLVTKTALVRFIEKNWTDMEYYSKNIEQFNEQQTWKDFNISERDLNIVRLHNLEHMSFKAIGDSYEKSGIFDLYEDVVKTAYHRAIKKIDALVLKE